MSLGTPTLRPGELMLHPGPDGEVSLVRFTAPADGTYRVQAAYKADDPHAGGTYVYVMQGGTQLFQGGAGLGYGATMAPQAVTLRAGQTLDFGVGIGADGSFNYDSTGLAASVTYLYGPATPPLANPDAASTDENVPVSVNVLANDSDPGNRPLTVTAVGAAGHNTAAIDPTTGQVVYTPAAGYSGSDSFAYTVSNGTAGATAAVTVQVYPGMPTGGNDPQAAQLVPVGEATADLNGGGLRLSQPLDFDQSPGTSVGGNPALVYNSSTVSARPVVQAVFASDPTQGVPDEVQAQLVWNGVAQGWVGFSTAGHQPGDSYLLGLQPNTPVSATGVYDYQVQMRAVYGGTPGAVQVVSGRSAVVAQDGSPYGSGWGIDGVSRLVAADNGVLWVTGSGDSRFFLAKGDGSYTSPAEDFGSLVKNTDGSWTYTATDRTLSQFNAAGLLTAVQSPDGTQIAYRYDGQGRLTEVDSPDGGVTTLGYDGATGLLHTVTEPGGRVVDLGHDGPNLTGLSLPDGGTRAFAYGGPGGRLTHDSWAPYDVTFGYSTAGLLTTIDRGQGSVYTVASAAGQGLASSGPAAPGSQEGVATISDGLGETTAYQLDARGRELAETAADGATQSWARNAAGQASSWTDARGLITLYVYDDSAAGKGDLVEEDDPNGGSTTYQYDPTFNGVTRQVQAVAPGRSTVTVSSYDPQNGELLSRTTAAGTAAAATTTYVWAGGLLQSMTDPDGNETDYGYDAARRLTSLAVYGPGATAGPPVHWEADAYDGAGNLASKTTATGVTDTVYSASNNLLSEDVYAPGGGAPVSSEQQTYLPAGEVRSRTDGDGNVTDNSFDSAGRQTAQALYAPGGTSPVSVQTDLYNAADRLVRAVDGDGNRTDYVSNAVGDVLSTALSGPGGGPPLATTTSTYDPDDNVLTVTDADGNVTAYTYNQENQLLTQTLTPAGGGPALTVAAYSYDEEGNVLTSTDAVGNVTAYTYDADGRVLTQTLTPAGGGPAVTQAAYTYDGDGNVLTSTDANGNVTTSTYNAQGQLLTRTLTPAGGGAAVTQVTNTYDGDGNLLTATDAVGNVTTNTYDAAGNLRGSTVAGPGGGAPVTSDGSAYDGAGNVTTSTDADGNVTTNTYNAQGLLLTQTLTPFGGGAALTLQSNTYDPNGNLLTATDALGNVTTNTYNAAGQVLTQTLTPAGGGTPVAQAVNTYDGDGNLLSATDADGNVTEYTYDDRGNVLTTALYAPGATTPVSTTSSTYDGNNNVLTSTDADGNVTTYTYNDRNQVLTQTLTPFGGGPTVAQAVNTYDGNGNLLTARDADGNVTTSTYNDQDQVLTQTLTPAGGGPTVTQAAYTYDAAGKIRTETDADGNVTAYTYDADGNVLSTVVTPPGGTPASAGSQTFDGNGNVLTSTDGDGNVTKYTYNDQGQVLTQAVYAPGGTTPVSFVSNTYDGDNNLVISTDGDGNVTRYTYNDQNQVLTTAVYAPGGSTPVSLVSNAYDAAGRLSTQTDGDGNVTKYTYDAEGNVVGTAVYGPYSSTPTASSVKTFDANGNVRTSTDGAGNVTVSTYNDQNQVLTQAVYAPGGSTPVSSVSYTYDGNGNVLTKTDGAGNVTAYTYDDQGNVLTTAVYASGSSTAVSVSTNAYDGAGNLVTQTDGDGNVTKYTYDAAGRKTSETAGYGTSAAATTTFAYDEAGNLLSVTDPDGNVTSYGYNAAGQQTSVTAQGHTSTTTYDAAGRLASTTDAEGRTITYAYDAAGRKTGETWYAADGSVTNTSAWTYDDAGRLLTASNNAGSYTYSYDAAGRVASVTDPFGLTLTMTYDGAGNRTEVDDSQGGKVTSTFDAAGRLTSRVQTSPGATPMRVDQSCDAAGNLASVTRYVGDGSGGWTPAGQTAYSYDAAGRVTDISATDAAGDPLSDYRYGYDQAGLLTTESDSFQGGTPVVTNYGYDPTGQLISSGSGTYSYDLNGNRSGTNGTTSTVGAGNQVQSDGTWNYTYDDAGNETGKVNLATGETWKYGYDAKNELISAQDWSSDPDTTSGAVLQKEVDYKYDVFGNKISDAVWMAATGATTTTKYALDGWNGAIPNPQGNEQWNVRGTLDGSGNLQTRYLDGDAVDQLFGRVDASGNAYWTLTDHLGSVRQVLDGSGAAVLSQTNYDAFGNVTYQTGSGYAGSYGWTGRQIDTETGLQYNRARWYDNNTGLWMTQDPLGFDAGDSNLYRYVNNRPTTATDPSGLLLYVAGSDATKMFQKELAGIGVETVVVGSSRPPWSSGWILAKDPAKVQKLVDDGKVAGFMLDNLKAMLSPNQHRIIGIANFFAINPTLVELTSGGSKWTLDNAAKSGVSQFIAVGVRNDLPAETIGKIVKAAWNASAGYTTHPCLAWVNSFTKLLSKELGTKEFDPVQGTGIQGRIVTWDISLLLQASTLFLSDSHSAFRMTLKDGSVFYFDIGSLGHGPITPANKVNGDDFFNEK